MIENELQLAITKEWAQKFKDAYDNFDAEVEKAFNVSPVFIELGKAALKSQYEELLEQIKEYETRDHK